MEDSSQRHNLTLNPSKIAFSFPPHRRRPLRSRTYRALIGILSHCPANSPQVRIQDVDGGDVQLTPVSEENGSITPIAINSNALLVPFPDSKQLEETLVKETSISLDKENNGGFDCHQATAPTLDPINSVADGGQGVAPRNSTSSIDFFHENQTADCAIQFSKEQDNANNQTVDLGTLEDLIVDNDFSIADYSEVIDSCFDMDMVTGSSKTGNGSKENVTVSEENLLTEAEHELQLKEMELEKLIYSANAGEEIEEGEISGEADVCLDTLYEDATSLGESTEMVPTSADFSNKEESMCDVEDRGCLKNSCVMSDPSLINRVNSDCNSIKVDSTATDGERRDCHSQTVIHESHMETRRSNPIASCSGKQAPSGRNLQENAAGNQMAATFEKDEDAGSKKRKNHPLTKEKKVKKRKKDRLKRAEKNRQLGVNRLKLQPVLKPKTVLYCRHYQQGRCREGEKCNFSHDTVPSTKSKPCGHFALNSCMKGDHCPYDHQLSKYPCNNYSANGSCSRGSDCLFSHESPSMSPTASKPESTSAQHTMSAKGGSSSKLNKPDVNFSSPLNNSNSSKHLDNHGKNKELLAARTAPRTAAGQGPKAISFLSNVNVGCKPILAAEHSNEMSPKRVAPRKRGINFLSFARPTPDDSSSNMLSKLLSNSNDETRKSMKGGSALTSVIERPIKVDEASRVPRLSFSWPSDQSTGGLTLDLSNSFKTSFLSKMPGSARKVVQSTLAFAGNFEQSIKVGSPYLQSKN